MNNNDIQAVTRDKKNFWRKVWLPGITVVMVGLFVLGYIWFKTRSSAPREAPEAENVLSAQIAMPFQVLIPAYLPKGFLREETQIIIDQVGPRGEPMVQLVYPTRRGDTLTFFEWLPDDQGEADQNLKCTCTCMSSMNCNLAEAGLSIGSMRLMLRVSSPTMLTIEQVRLIIDTLGPAMNSQIYSSMKEVPITFTVPPAVDVPLNTQGVQELTLVVTPNGYSPEHFAVQKGTPVVLTFRQIGQVGCGNELIFQWGDKDGATLKLVSSNDIQTLEFTPKETGDYRFNCPHLIYRGVMTVVD
jgi:hypothetical protein